VITIQPPGEPDPQVFSDITDVLGTRKLIRHVPNSYNDANIRAAIDVTSRKTLIISGVYTEIAVQTPALAYAAQAMTCKSSSIPAAVPIPAPKKRHSVAYASFTSERSEESRAAVIQATVRRVHEHKADFKGATRPLFSAPRAHPSRLGG